MFAYRDSSLPCDSVQWGIAVQDYIWCHVDQTLENNCLELTEVPRIGLVVIVIDFGFAHNLEVQKYHFMENSALKQIQGMVRSLGEVQQEWGWRRASMEMGLTT